METKYLQTLQAILETGSFQKAALKLNYSQSTVTFQMQQLEQDLSIKLFERVGRRMQLTHAGKELLPYMEDMIRTEYIIRNYNKGLTELTGELRIAIPDELLCSKMQPILQAFIRQAPNVHLVVKALSCYAIREAIISGGADLGVHCDIGGYPNTVHVEPLTSYQVCLAASPTFSPSQLDFITPHQRKDISLIVSDPHSVHQKRFDAYLDRKEIILNHNLELWSIGAAKTGVMSNLGISYFPVFTIEKELKNGTLVPIQTELDEQAVDVVIAYHKNKFVSRPMKLLIQLLRNALCHGDT